MAVLGIDLGSESCYIGTVRAGGIEILTNDTGQRATPSYLGFGEKDRTFGVSAKSAHVTNVKNTIFGFKRLIGRRFFESFVQNELTYLPYPIYEMKDHFLGVKVCYRKKDTFFYIQQLVAMLLAKLKDIAEGALNTSITSCVLAIPSYYNDSARRAMLDAGRIAGLNIIKLMNETSAVALSYGFYKQNLSEDKPVTVVFVDMGHSSLQVSICAISKGRVKVLATTHDVEVGGRDFDNAIVRHFATDFKKRYKLDVLSNERAIIRLLNECEKLKKQLSANPKPLPLNIECFMEDKDVSGHLGRDEMERICADLLIKAENTMRRALSEAKLHFADISAVELVGGSSRIPAIKQLVHKVFRVEPSTTLNLDEAVARGCALQCAMFSPNLKVKEFYITDVQPYPIKLTWWISKNEQGDIAIFPKNHPIPFSKYLTYFRTEQFTLDAHYGTPEQKTSNETGIGSFTMCNVTCSSTGESAKVRLKVRVNIHGIFTIASAVILDKDADDTEVPDQKNEDLADIRESFGIPLPPPDFQGDGKDQSDKKHKKQVPKPIDLPIEVKAPEMSSSDIKKFMDDELKMAQIDSSEKARVDSKNALEEFIYDIRCSLENELNAFIDQKECTAFVERLGRVENWLYEDGEDQSQEIFTRELTELKVAVDPVLLRKREFDNRSAAFDELSNTVEGAHKIIDLYMAKDPQYAHLDPKFIDELRRLLNKKSEWLDQKLSILSQVEKHKNPPVLVEQILQEKQSLIDAVNHILKGPDQKKSYSEGENASN